VRACVRVCMRRYGGIPAQQSRRRGHVRSHTAATTHHVCLAATAHTPNTCELRLSNGRCVHSAAAVPCLLHSREQRVASVVARVEHRQQARVLHQLILLLHLQPNVEFGWAQPASTMVGRHRAAHRFKCKRLCHELRQPRIPSAGEIHEAFR